MTDYTYKLPCKNIRKVYVMRTIEAIMSNLCIFVQHQIIVLLDSSINIFYIDRLLITTIFSSLGMQ